MPEKRHTPARGGDMASLAGGIAHDFNNLLTIVRTYTGFLQQDLGNHPALAHVEQLQSATNRMAQVVRQLQAFSGGTLTAPIDVRPGDLIRRLSETLKHVLMETVEFRVSIKSLWVANVDPFQLERAIVSLLLYIAESVHDGGRIWLSAMDRDVHSKEFSVKAGRYIHIKLSSSAPALTAQQRAHVLEPAFRKQRGSTGADLRLASVWGIIDQAGGYIEPLSGKSDGLGFNVLLPAVERQAKTPVRLEIARDRDLKGSEVILVVEDDPDVRRTVRESLEQFSYSVLEAEDGADALRLIDLLNAPPDLLLTDVVMPEVGGRELIDVLGREGKLPKVLLMSGYTDTTLEKAMPTNNHPFIAKPFTHEELAIRVRDVLESES